ncbi:MAG: glycosyltransferase [Chitinophagales bacterium]|nr:glycosyltransferase [Chitinophagales bacterium]
MMKIAILGPAHPLRGGLSAYNERLAKEYISQGDEVKIYTFSLQYPEFLFPGTSQYSNLPAPKDLDIEVCINSVNPWNWIKVGLKIKDWKPDILIVRFWLPFMGPCLGTISRIVRLNRHTKVISILDNVIPHEKRFGDHILTKYFVGAISGFITMSKSVYNDLSVFNKKKPRELTPHPLFDNYGSPISKLEAKKILGLEMNTPYILFFGLIRDYKGLDILLNAMVSLKKQQAQLKLIIAGEYYSNQKEYEKLIDALDIRNQLELHTRYIPDDEVATYFCAVDLVVQPYKSATQSGVTQICYHFDKPMVVTNVGGLPEIVPNGKVGYVVTQQPLDVANAINNFYMFNKEHEFVQNIQVEKEKYSWNTLSQKIKNMAKQL